jgi:hypothetical protein
LAGGEAATECLGGDVGEVALLEFGEHLLGMSGEAGGGVEVWRECEAAAGEGVG